MDRKVIPDHASGTILIVFYPDGEHAEYPVVGWSVMLDEEGEPAYADPITPGDSHGGSYSNTWCLEISVRGKPVDWQFPADRSFRNRDEAILYGVETEVARQTQLKGQVRT